MPPDCLCKTAQHKLLAAFDVELDEVRGQKSKFLDQSVASRHRQQDWPSAVLGAGSGKKAAGPAIDRKRLVVMRLAIDVAVTTPFGSHNLTCTEPCESYAESKKHACYDKSFKSNGV